MNPRPRPKSRRVLYRRWKRTGELGEHRTFDCKEYEQCLTVAITKLWDSWTCARCPLRCRAAPETSPDRPGLQALAVRLGPSTSSE